MTDSRLRGEWLNSMKFDDLSDVAWRVFTGALMWCNENGTDGFVPTRYLKMLHPDGTRADAYAELVSASLWEQLPSGYRLQGWSGALGQSTANEVETYKANARERQQRWRDREREKKAKRVGFTDSPRDVTRYETSDVTENVGTGTGTGTGEAQDKGTENWFVNEATGEIKDEDSNPVPASQVTTWDVAPIGRSCPVCGKPMGGYPASMNVCESQDDRHNKYRAASAA